VIRATLHESEIRRVVGLPEGGETVVQGVAPLEAGEDHCLYFTTMELADHARESLAGRAGCILIAPKASGLAAHLRESAVLEVDDPRAAIARVLEFIRTETRQPPLVARHHVAKSAVLSPLAVIESPVDIGDDVVVEAFCVIGPDVTIGRGTIIRSGARIFPRVSIGEESIIGVNSVIGQEGFGFVRDVGGNKTRVPHLGGVAIGSHVEIGVLTSIQGGTILTTTVEDYAKLDEHVELGHNVRIGRNASLTGGVIVAGHAVIEAEAWVGINSSIRDGRHVGARSLVGMHSSVQEDIPEDAVARAPRPAVEARSQADPSTIGFRKA
jgi:UDP-3-O-[3-hydroxymyristoyl] glucosamine N-acyltransferase